MKGEVLVARKTNRIGICQLSRVADQYYIALRNRTYYSKHPITREAAGRWLRSSWLR